MGSVALTIPSGRLRAPFMGVPVPGSKPIVLDTEQVRAALNGVTVTDVAVIDTTRQRSIGGSYSWEHKEGAPTRAIEVTYRHGKSGKGRSVFYDRISTSLTVRNRIREWAEIQRKRRAAPVAKLSTKARQAGIAIRKLEKEKGELWLHRPTHPFLRLNAGIDSVEGRARARLCELRWHEEKSRRKALANIAAQVIERRVTHATAYKMLRDLGFGFEKFSELRKYDKDSIGDNIGEYWRHLHFFVDGLMPCREGYQGRVRRKFHCDEDVFQRHAEARVKYIAAKRQAAAIDLQIAAMQELVS